MLSPWILSQSPTSLIRFLISSETFPSLSGPDINQPVTVAANHVHHHADKPVKSDTGSSGIQPQDVPLRVHIFFPTEPELFCLQSHGFLHRSKNRLPSPNADCTASSGLWLFAILFSFSGSQNQALDASLPLCASQPPSYQSISIIPYLLQSSSTWA